MGEMLLLMACLSNLILPCPEPNLDSSPACPGGGHQLSLPLPDTRMLLASWGHPSVLSLE